MHAPSRSLRPTFPPFTYRGLAYVRLGGTLSGLPLLAVLGINYGRRPNSRDLGAGIGPKAGESRPLRPTIGRPTAAFGLEGQREPLVREKRHAGRAGKKAEGQRGGEGCSFPLHVPYKSPNLEKASLFSECLFFLGLTLTPLAKDPSFSQKNLYSNCRFYSEVLPRKSS